MKVKILIDTSCGIGREEAKSLGYEMIALPFLLDDDEYDEDKITFDDFYNKLKNAKNISTSKASMEKVMNIIDKLLEDADVVMYFPITSGLSSSYETALAIKEKEKYKDRLIVVDHKTISVLERSMLLDVKRLLDKGVSPLHIKELAEENAKNNRIYIAVDTLDYLKKGGRVSAMSATIGSILNIKPVLFSNGNKFEVIKKTRGMDAAKNTLIELIKDDYNNLFNGIGLDKFCFGIAYTKCKDEAIELKNRAENEIGTEFIVDELSTVIGCHIGEGAVATAIYKKIDES